MLTEHASVRHSADVSARSSSDPECGCLSWYCVQATPGGIYTAFNKLSTLARGRPEFRCHLPRLVVGEKPVTKHGRPVIENGKRVTQDKIEPLFPGYLFVSFDVRQPGWGDIVRTEGVAKLISRQTPRGWVPTKLPDGLVEALQARGRAGDGVIDTRAPAFPILPSGTQGQILSGPFAGFEGITTRPASDRVQMLIAIFGRQTRVEVGRVDFQEMGKG